MAGVGEDAHDRKSNKLTGRMARFCGFKLPNLGFLLMHRLVQRSSKRGVEGASPVNTLRCFFSPACARKYAFPDEG
jgi:hypothetical protein